MSAIWSLCGASDFSLNTFISVTTKKGEEVEEEAEMSAIKLSNFLLMLSIFTEKMQLLVSPRDSITQTEKLEE